MLYCVYVILTIYILRGGIQCLAVSKHQWNCTAVLRLVYIYNHVLSKLHCLNLILIFVLHSLFICVLALMILNQASYSLNVHSVLKVKHYIQKETVRWCSTLVSCENLSPCIFLPDEKLVLEGGLNVCRIKKIFTFLKPRSDSLLKNDYASALLFALVLWMLDTN